MSSPRPDPDPGRPRRVVITGLGPVSNIGIGVRDFGLGLRAGRIGYSTIRSFDPTGFPCTVAGEVRGFDPGQMLHRVDPGQWGRSGTFAAAAARLAVQDAGLDLAGPAAVPADRVAVVMGTTSGESQLVDALSADAAAGGCESFDVSSLTRLPAARLANAASEEVGARGMSVTLATACSAGNYAIGYGYDAVAEGEADVVLAGGADSVCRWAHAGFYRLGALTHDNCAPFDAGRTGILTAEGGVALVLEARDHALARGARIYAEMLGYGLNCDARHMVAPDPGRIAECMQVAHRNAGIKPQEVDYICAHGTGTAINDRVEASAVGQVFGAQRPPMSSIKSMLGHSMGAASGFGAVACVLAIDQGFLPPTVNWSTPDPDFEWLDPVPNQPRAATVRVAQNNGFAFGGNNCITIFGAPQ